MPKTKSRKTSGGNGDVQAITSVPLDETTRQRYLKLEALAMGTLKTGKSADGLKAVEWWKAGKVQKIIDYCMQDVKGTRDIFQFGRQNGFITIHNSDTNIREVPVQWN